MRSFLAGLCGLLATLLLPAAIAAVWTDAVVTDTDEFVSAVAPLATDPEVKEAAEERLTAAVTARLDGNPIAEQFGAELRTVIRAGIARAVDSTAFVEAWEVANRAAHTELVRVLEDESDAEVVRISLSGVAEQVLSDLGLAGADVPAPEVTIVLARGERLEQAQEAYRWVERLGLALPLACGALGLLAVGLARRRVRALAWLGVGAALGGALLLVAARLSVPFVWDQAPPADREVTELVWHAVTESLRTSAWGTVGAGVLVALVCGGVATLLGRRRPV